MTDPVFDVIRVQRDVPGAPELSLRTARWGDGVPQIILCHDGLGSIPQWRDVPADIAERTGLTVLAFERAGHGASTPAPTGPWPTLWLHHEAEVLAKVLGVLGTVRPLVVGHSDGASIALLHAAATTQDLAGVIALAAHSWVEDLTHDAITGMRASPDEIIEGLSRHHEHPEAIFEAWSGVWVSDDFRRWDIRGQLATIAAPTIIAQGACDEYALADHATQTAAAVGPAARCIMIPEGGHLIHHTNPDDVAALVADFAAEVRPD